MEIKANNEISSTLDSTLTLIDVVSNRLELSLFDYRRIDDLKLELAILRNVLRRAGYLSSSLKSSLLFVLSEELRHLYFVLRADSEKRSRFMVGEIAEFRESVKCFQQRFCEWNTHGYICMLDGIWDKLQPLVPHQYPGGQRDELIKLKVELKLVKLFYVCARKQASLECFLSKIKYGISEKTEQFYHYFLTLKGSSVNHELAQAGPFVPI